MNRLSFHLIVLWVVVACIAMSSFGRASSTLLSPWQERLEQLEPSDPTSYFVLAEDVADAARSDAETALARRLFALAAALAPDRFGHSACLALASLEPDVHHKRRLLALAALLGERSTAVPHALPTQHVTEHDPAAALAVSEAFSFFRRGLSHRGESRLNRSGARQWLQSMESASDEYERLVRDLRLTRENQRWQPGERRLVTLLNVEAALLAGQERSWSADLALSRGRPLIEVDPVRLDESLAVDSSRPRYRNGNWVP